MAVKTYRGTVQADKYPLDFTVQASSWSTAAARIVKAWQKKRPGSRSETLSIKIVKVATPPESEAGNGKI